MIMVFGVDPGRKGFHAWVLLTEHKEVRDAGKVKGNEELVSILAQQTRMFQKAGHQVWVAIEDGHAILVEMICRREFDRVYRINAAKLAVYKRLNDLSGGKTDLVDAQAAGEYLIDNHRKMRLCRPATDLEKQANCLSSGLDSIRQSKTEAWERFWGNVDYVVPELREIGLRFDTDWFLKTIDLLGRCRTMGKKALIDYCRKQGCLAEDRKIGELLSCLKRLERAGNYDLVKLQATSLSTLRVEEKCWVKKCRAVLKEWKQGLPLFTISHVGPKTGIRLLAHVGEDWSEVSTSSLNAYSGTAPVFRGSGTPDPVTAKKLRKQGKTVKADRRCHRLASNKTLKTTLCLFSLYSKEHHPWAKKAYSEMRSRGQEHWEALRNLSMKWLRIMVHLVQNDCVYDAEIHERNQRIHSPQISV